METETQNRINVLENAQDIAVIENLGKDRFVYAAKPSLETQAHLYELSVSNPEDGEISVFQDHWKFDKERGITGSSTYLALRFDKLALRPNELWVPELLEAKTLDRQGKLENGVYRDYGLVVYSIDNPNKRLAESFVPRLEKLGLQLPLINQFRALDYNTNEDGELDLSFVQNPKAIISGKEAQKQISLLNYTSTSGVRRLSRDWGASWNAGWDGLDFSYDGDRVDWICGVATKEDLEEAHDALMGRKYSEKIKGLENEMRTKQSDFSSSLKR